MAGLIIGCDDDLIQGPEPPFSAEFGFGAVVNAGGPGRITELFAVSADGRQRYVTLGLRCDNRAPAISPNGKSLVFESCDPTGTSRDLYRVEVDRLIPVNITNSPVGESHPAWSPRGDWVAFLSDRGLYRTLELIGESGSGRAVLLETPSQIDMGGWSPDGSFVVAAVDDPGGASSQIVTVSVPLAEQMQRTFGQGRRTDPRWAPDYGSIAYVRDGELWHLRLGPNEEERFPLPLDSVSGPLSWTPDARSLVMTGWSAGRTDICRVDVNDSSLAVLTRTDHPGTDPVVLPDGQSIVYLAFTGVNYKLFTMDLQGFGQRRVTTFRVEEFGPVARPLSFNGSSP